MPNRHRRALRCPRKRGVQLAQERHQRFVVQHLVAKLGRVAGNVAQGPHGLLAHVVVGRVEQLDKHGHSALFDALAGVL